jgi:HK97 gp10 family phage protein
VAADVSQIVRAMNGIVTAAERVEVRLKPLAHRRAMAVRAAAQARVRVATGATREHIIVVDDSSNRQFRVEVQDVPGRNPMVPVWIEFGTSKVPARPFLGPAVDESRTAFLADVEALTIEEAEAALQ